MRDCPNTKIQPMQACVEYQDEWRAHVYHCSQANLSGVERMLQRPGESMPWQPSTERNAQLHDEETHVKKDRAHFFGPARFYCVETTCALCGLVIAWAKFAKSESETNILSF